MKIIINEIITDYINHEYDIAAHFHIFDSNNDFIPDLILYFDYSTIDLAWCPYLEEYRSNKISFILNSNSLALHCYYKR
jgi:hypothetical protein